jgi:F-box protein 11
MNTNNEIARIVSGWLEGRVVEPPPGSLQSALALIDQTPQQHHRWLPWWFGRGGGTTGSAAVHGRMTPVDDRRYRIMFGTTAAATAVAAIGLVAVLAIPQGTVEPAPQPLPAVLGTTWTVAPDGGDFSTISEAVAAAQDGDTVLVAPGTYEDAFIIDRDITLRGEGDAPRHVVIRIPAEAPPPVQAIEPLHGRFHAPQTPAFPPVGVQLLDTDATLENLQVFGLDDGIGVLVRGGSPTFEGLEIKHRDCFTEPDSFTGEQVLAGGLFVLDGAEVNARDSTVWNQLRIDGGSSVTFIEGTLQYAMVTLGGASSLTLEDNTIWGEERAVQVADGSSAVIRGNDILTGGVDVYGDIAGGGSILVEGNFFSGAPGSAVFVSEDATGTISGNTFQGNLRGVTISHADARLESNRFEDNGTAVVLSGSSSTLSGNSISGGDIGVSVVFSGSPVIVGNSIEDATSRGIIIGGGTRPRVEGNTVCGSDIDLYIEPSAHPVMGDNDICIEGPAVDG